MSVHSDDEDLDDSWKIDLEILLLDDADFASVRGLCRNRPVPDHLRKDVWRVCLRPELHQNSMQEFDEVYDLPNQTELHQDCLTVADKVVTELRETLMRKEQKRIETEESKEEEDKNNDDIADELLELAKSDGFKEIPNPTKLAGDFEAVLTHFAKMYSYSYSSDKNWLVVLGQLYKILRCTTKSDLYACFISFQHRFIASGFGQDNRACTVLRLLLQYHEPSLCSFLDCQKVALESFSQAWMTSLFAGFLQEDALLALWDVYFLISDPLFVILISLVILVNAKNRLLGEAEEDDDTVHVPSSWTKDELLETLRKLPNPVAESDVKALVDLAKIFSDQTPTSFRTHYLPLLFGNAEPEPGQTLLSSSLCMNVTPEEILGASQGEITFLLIDCRPANEYNAGHLNTAFYLNANLMISDPAEFKRAVQTLFQVQKRSLASEKAVVAGEHIAFLGSGCGQEEDQEMHMVVAYFLQMNTAYVSIVEGGFQALHNALDPTRYASQLRNHSPRQCRVCVEHMMNLSASGKAALSANQLANSANEAAQKAVSMASNALTAEGGLLKRFSSLLKTKPNAAGTPCAEATTEGVKLRQSANGSNAAEKRAARQSSTASYRNTSAVFTIDDETDDSDLDAEDPVAFVNNSTRQSPMKSPTRSDSKCDPLRSPSHSTPEDDPFRPGGLDTCEVGDRVETSYWFRRSEVRGVFPCRFLDSTNRNLGDNGHLVLAARHVIVMKDEKAFMGSKFQPNKIITGALQSVLTRVKGDQSGQSERPQSPSGKRDVVVKVVPIEHLMRITSNRTIPELISFHHAAPEALLTNQGDEKFRLYLEQAGEAVKMIKTALFQAHAET